MFPRGLEARITDEKDSCFAVDDNGALQPQQWGQGLVKCKDCSVDLFELTCDCKDKNGNYVTTSRGLGKLALRYLQAQIP